MQRNVETQLTTPSPHLDDSAFPGENWFFYWRSSTSLWKNKLQEYRGPQPIFAPLNWAYHTETGDRYDFGQIRPEANLKRLVEVAQELGKEIVFLLPLGPVPFLANGGLPPLLASGAASTEEGLNYAVLDAEGRVNRLYSYFDPRIYQSFHKYVWALGQYFSEKGILASIYGMEPGYCLKDKFYPYFTDFSRIFEQGFSRFLRVKAEEKKDEEDNLPPQGLIERTEKNRLEFHRVVEGLYDKASQNCLGGHWGGTLSFSFLGGSHSDIFARTHDSLEDPTLYLKSFFESLTYDAIPSSVLLPKEAKEGVLKKALSDLINTTYLRVHLNEELAEEGLYTSFVPLSFFEIYDGTSTQLSSQRWMKMGLLDHIKQHYRWAYRYHQSFKYQSGPEYTNVRVHFARMEEMQQKELQFFLRLFLNGETVVLDRSKIDSAVEKKLNLFILENSLETEEVNHVTSMSKITLGEGNLILFDGAKIVKAASSKQASFWERVFTQFSLCHLNFDSDKNVEYFWMTRTPSMNELNYEEVRRLCLYNPTSYKRKVKMTPHKKFALVKIVDEVKTEVKIGAGIQIELLPGGSVSLDFGYFDS